MTPLQLRTYRHKLGLSQRQYAEKIGAKLDAYQSWEQGRYPIPEWLIKRIEDEKKIKEE